MRTLLPFLCAAALAVSAAGGPRIRDVHVSPAFFNPTTRQTATVHLGVTEPGTVTLSILDRDRFPIRELAPRPAARGAMLVIAWDGRDDAGRVVPDEAYNIRVEWRGKGGETEVYDPSLGFQPVDEDPQPRSYSRINGVLSYRLARPSRVHIEAGQAVPDPVTGRSQGPILRTIVNREPRVAGAVIEKWSGFDESGTVRICDLPHFAVSVLATSLPDNAILTRGNNRESFVDYALRTRPPAKLAVRHALPAGAHHRGLNALEDYSPALRVEHASAVASGAPLDLAVRVEGPTAAHFLHQPTRLSVWVDEKRVAAEANPGNPVTVTIAAEDLAEGEHHVALNWGSDFGPAAVQAFRIRVAPRPVRTVEGGR